MTASRTHLLVGEIVVSPFGGSQTGRSACGRRHAGGYTLEQASANEAARDPQGYALTGLVSCERCRLKITKQARFERDMRELDRIAPLPKRGEPCIDPDVRTPSEERDEQRLAHVVDDDGQVTISGRAYFAASAARNYAADVAAARAELDAARTLDAYTTALRKLATAARACNERAIRGLEYITLDGKGEVAGRCIPGRRCGLSFCVYCNPAKPGIPKGGKL